MSADNGNHNEGYVPKINQFAQNYLNDLKQEQSRLPEEFPLLNDLISDAVDRLYSTGRIPGKELKADVFQQKPIKLSQNVYLPIKQYPKFNFQGKLLGPKGNTLKRLHQETMCSIALRGRHSMRDQEREEQLRQSGDPAYNHLNKNLYIEIATVAPPAEAYARIAYALSEIRKYIIPDKNDEISQEQYRELMEIDPSLVKGQFNGHKNQGHKSVFSKLNLNKQSTSNGGWSNNHTEEEQQESSPTRASNNFTDSEAPSFKRTEPSPFARKTRGFRSQPYNRNVGTMRVK